MERLGLRKTWVKVRAMGTNDQHLKPQQAPRHGGASLQWHEELCVMEIDDGHTEPWKTPETSYAQLTKY